MALETLREKKTVAELAKKYKVHPIRINERKRQLAACSAKAFERGLSFSSAEPPDLKELHAKIDKHVLKIVFLSGALTKA